MKRRDFLERTVGAAGVLGLAGIAEAGLARPAAATQFPTPLLDAHAHVNSLTATDRINRLVGAGSVEALDGDALIQRMDADGIQRALVLSTAYMMAMDAVEGDFTPAEERAAVQQENDFNAAECAKHPLRLIPFCSVNPKRTWAAEEIDRCSYLLGARGVKFHFWNSVVDLRSPESLDNLRALFRHIAERDMPVVVHVFNGSVADFGADDVERFVREVIVPNPDLRLSFAHAGGAGGTHPRIIEIFRRLTEVAPPDSEVGQRLRIDISAVMFTRRFKAILPTSERALAAMGELMRAWGPERVLWGSDMIPDYLSQTEGVWPLSGAEWEVVAGRDETEFFSA